MQAAAAALADSAAVQCLLGAHCLGAVSIAPVVIPGRSPSVVQHLKPGLHQTQPGTPPPRRCNFGHLRSRGRDCDSWSRRYQVVTAWMGGCRRTGKTI